VRHRGFIRWVLWTLHQDGGDGLPRWRHQVDEQSTLTLATTPPKQTRLFEIIEDDTDRGTVAPNGSSHPACIDVDEPTTIARQPLDELKGGHPTEWRSSDPP
jgi:hypothetical protein